MIAKQLHDRMKQEEKQIKERKQEERQADQDGAGYKSACAQFRASYVTRKAMRDGSGLAGLIAHTEQRAAEAAEYPPSADEIRRELFYITSYARRLAGETGAALPPIFADWAALAAELDEIGRKFAGNGEASARIQASNRIEQDFRIVGAPALNGHWTIDRAMEEIARIEKSGRGASLAAILERGLQWRRQNTDMQYQIEQIDHFLRSLYDSRARAAHGG